MKRLCNFTTILLTLFMMSACTLMDNDLRDLPDNPAYREIVHEEGDDFTVDYQYQPWTILVDDIYTPYIYAIDYEDDVLYLYDYIPSDLLPKEGNSLAAKAGDKLPFGLSYKVLEVVHIDGFYAVIMQRAHTQDIFKHLVFDLDAEIGTQLVDTIDEQGNETTTIRARRLTRAERTRADDPEETVKKLGEWKLDMVELFKKIAKRKNLKDAALLQFAQSVGEKAASSITGIKGPVHELNYVPQDARDWKDFFKKKDQLEKAGNPNSSKDEKNGENKIGEKTEGGDKSFKNRMKDAFHIEVDALVEFVVTVNPKVKIKTHIDLQKEQTDTSFEICGTYGVAFSLAGSLSFIVDWVSLLGRDWSSGDIISIVAGIPVWYQINPQLLTILEVGGSFSYNCEKYFSFGIGTREGYGKKDGLYFIKNSRDMKIEANKNWNYAINEIYGSTAELHGNLDLVKFSPQFALGIGLPPLDILEKKAKLTQAMKEAVNKFLKEERDMGLNIRIEWSPYLTVRININDNAGIKRHGQGHFHFGIILSLQDGYLVLNPWPGFSLKWNFLKSFLNLFGNDTGVWEFVPFDFWKYPALEDVTIMCVNPNATDPNALPVFDASFKIADLGIGYAAEKGQQSIPMVYVYDKSDTYRKHALFSKGLEFLTARDVGKVENIRFSSPDIVRDKEYVFVIKMLAYDGDKYIETQYFEDHVFTSTSPSAHIYSDDMIYWTAKYWETDLWNFCGNDSWKTKEPDPTKVNAIWYDYKFRTNVRIVDYKKVNELGFYIGKKKYVAKGKITSEYVNALWNLPGKREGPRVRTLDIVPYVKIGKIIYRWPTPYQVKLDYASKPRDPNFGGNGVPFKWFDSKTYAQYGKDNYEENRNKFKDNGTGIDLEINESKSRAIRSGVLVDEDNDIQTFEFIIDPDDLEE